MGIKVLDNQQKNNFCASVQVTAWLNALCFLVVWPFICSVLVNVTRAALANQLVDRKLINQQLFQKSNNHFGLVLF